MTRYRLIGLLGLAVAALPMSTQVRRRFQFVVVAGQSMTPTFGNGDLLLGRRRLPTVDRGDVAVFAIASSDYGDGRVVEEPRRRVKRVVAVGGDSAPPFIPERLRERYGGIVPDGFVALAGDAPLSEGSDHFGYIEISRIESVIIRRLRRRSSPLPDTGREGTLVLRPEVAAEIRRSLPLSKD